MMARLGIVYAAQTARQSDTPACRRSNRSIVQHDLEAVSVNVALVMLAMLGLLTLAA